MYIYIHIPFCKNICNYCDFPKLLYDKKFTDRYLYSLESEIKERYSGEEVLTIYIGGGTPTSLDFCELRRLLDITNIFNKDKLLEFTIESNIESLSIDKIKLLKEYNVNRVSLGVQSFNSNNLKELNRCHNLEQTKEVISNLFMCGINNISIDYIYGINENISILKEDMDIFLSLNIPHISCYSLIIEDNTIFGIRKRKYIDEDVEYEMYNYINNFLRDNNYNQYEISNYCRDGYQSIHNLNYWNNGYYYGFGLGAVSYIDSVRRSNTGNLSKYLDRKYICEENVEDINTKISNELILGLRKIDGIDINLFREKYNKNIETLYNIDELIKENKLVLDNGYLKLNPKYIYLSNDILINFV